MEEMSHVDFLQIGSHIGNSKNDKLYHQEFSNKNLILIEPIPFLFEILVHNYKVKSKTFLNNCILLNVAVSNKEGTLDLYVPSQKNNLNQLPEWISQLGSIHKNHINATYDKADSVLMEKITVPCFRLNSIIDKYKIKTIDYLLVDTEGHDFDILMDLDLDIIKPNKICFENTHTDGSLTRGNNYIKLLQKLFKYGYKIIQEDNEDTIVSL